MTKDIEDEGQLMFDKLGKKEIHTVIYIRK
jgi:hypothetical protein